MARKALKLKVVITPRALRDLEGIWDYNAEHRGVPQADAWDAFLRAKIRRLAVGYGKGRPVEYFPDLKHIVAKKESERPRSH